MHASDTTDGTRPTRPRPAQARARQLAPLREQRAIELRLLGLSYDAIASSLLPCPDHRPDGDRECTRCAVLYPGGRSAAKKAVDRALAREYDAGADTREQLRRHQLGQIDLLLRRAMRDAVRGDVGMMREARHLLDRRARLMGLDAPQRHVVTSELDAEIEAMMEQLADAEAMARAAGDTP